MTESPQPPPNPMDPVEPSIPPAGAAPPPPPPAYGQPQAPGYGQQPPPVYGQQPPVYGQQPPAYGQPPVPGSYAPPPQGGYVPGAMPMMSESDMKLWGGAAWWGTFILGFIAPLVIMLTKGNENPFVRKQAVESLNFNLTMLIAEIVTAFLILVLIGILLFPVVLIFHLVITIIAAIKASNGEDYRAPLNIRMVS